MQIDAKTIRKTAPSGHCTTGVRNRCVLMPSLHCDMLAKYNPGDTASGNPKAPPGRCTLTSSPVRCWMNREVHILLRRRCTQFCVQQRAYALATPRPCTFASRTFAKHLLGLAPRRHGYDHADLHIDTIPNTPRKRWRWRDVWKCENGRAWARVWARLTF